MGYAKIIVIALALMMVVSCKPAKSSSPSIIADTNFRSWCQSHFDFNGDGKFTAEDAAQVERLNLMVPVLDSKGSETGRRPLPVKSLDGIEHFTALVELNCPENTLEGTLDLSSNLLLTDLYISNNRLTELILPRNGELTRVVCRNNQLTELDLTDCDNVYLLNCSDNPIRSLELSGLTSLGALECAYCDLSELNITTNPALRSLNCNDNPNGMTIVVAEHFDLGSMLHWNIGNAQIINH